MDGPEPFCISRVAIAFGLIRVAAQVSEPLRLRLPLVVAARLVLVVLHLGPRQPLAALVAASERPQPLVRTPCPTAL